MKRVHKEASAEQEKHGEQTLRRARPRDGLINYSELPPRSSSVTGQVEVDDGEKGKATSFDILVQVLISCPHIFY